MPVTDADPQIARENSEAIYAIIGRLGEPPTPDELAKIRALINAGADLDQRYNDGNRDTLLEITLTREYTDAALLLVENGAALDARCIQNMTPFIWAAMKGNHPVLKAMIDSGRAPPPDRDAYDSLGAEKTALICAAEGGHTACAAELIRYGADMNFQNNKGCSALDYARAKDRAGVVRAMEIEACRIDAEKFRDGTVAPVAIGKPLRFKTPKIS